MARMIDTVVGPVNVYVEDPYARSGTYAMGGIDKPGEIPKGGAYAEAGLGKAGAEFSIFEAEVKLPSASVTAEASVLGVSVMTRAEVGSASLGAGPVKAKLGLGVDTGASAGENGVEVKVLGTGFSVGKKTSFSLLNSEAACEFQ